MRCDEIKDGPISTEAMEQDLTDPRDDDGLEDWCDTCNDYRVFSVELD